MTEAEKQIARHNKRIVGASSSGPAQPKGMPDDAGSIPPPPPSPTHSTEHGYSMDSDPVRILILLGPADDGLTVTWIGPLPRWRARDVLRDFAYGITWEGRHVMRALILG